jgi:hypothetical protein
MAETGTDGNPKARPDGRLAAEGAEWGDAKFYSLLGGRGFVQDPTRVEDKPEGKIFGY